jgi:antitoxin component YwqK of YwqJK toxin-antitoxin module
MSATYDYYADGRINHAYDLNNNFWDRSYAFDQATRISRAYSNRRARNQTPSTSQPDPYSQTVTYDVWGNSNRNGTLYSGALSDNGTYTNNRRNGWSYDSAGNTLLDTNTHTFNASSKQSQVVSLQNA